jgi:Zn finger protein HypA/HybF involved in hydrogenase expression
MKHIFLVEDEVEEIDEETQTALDKIKEQNDLDDDLAASFGEAIMNSQRIKYILFSCPVCGEQDVEPLFHTFMCDSCNKIKVISQDIEISIKSVEEELNIGDKIVRTPEGWMTKEKFEETEMNMEYITRQAILKTMQDLSIPVYKADTLEINQNPMPQNEKFKSLIICDWITGEYALLDCDDCDDSYMQLIYPLHCPKCEKLITLDEKLSRFTPVLDKTREGENRIVSCYAVRNNKQQVILVDKVEKNKGHILGMNTNAVYLVEELNKQPNFRIFDYEFSD